jgi:four helix bundle protein
MIYFDHEKLKVYQLALDFEEWTIPIRSRIHYYMDIKGQLERASNSIVLNLAEGNGKFSNKDKCRYFDISLGSAFECAGCLDILFREKKLNEEELKKGKIQLKAIVSMIVGLIKSNSDRIYEENKTY